VKAALKDHELVPEANVEHACVKDLIAQVKLAEPDGEMSDARVKVMGEFVKHHVKEEQTEMGGARSPPSPSLPALWSLGQRMRKVAMIMLQLDSR